MARGNSKANSEYLPTSNPEAKWPSDAYFAALYPGIPTTKSKRSLLPLAEAFKKYPQMEEAIGKYEPYYNRYTFRTDGIPYGVERGMETLKKDLDEKLSKLERKVDFKLGPFQQKESDGVIESKTTILGLGTNFELVARRRWSGPLERGDPPVSFQGDAEYFIRRIPRPPKE